MRLGQLARKLDVKTKDVVSFVHHSLQQEIKEHPNSKVPDELIEDIIAFFKPNEKQLDQSSLKNPEIESNADTDKKSEQVANKSIEIEKEFHNEDTDVVPEDKVEPTNSDEDQTEKNTSEENTADIKEVNLVDGVIKAPKLEVKGVKVVGKIDLPEKPIVEEVETESSADKEEITDLGEQKESTEEITTLEEKPKKRPQKKRNPRAKKTPSKDLSYEEKKQLEMERYKKLQAEKKKKEKEKKKRHYEKLIQQKAPSKDSKKKSTKKRIQQKQANKPIQPTPKTVWGKFLRWLNT